MTRHLGPHLGRGLLAAGLLLPLAACAAGDRYPVTRQDDVVDDYHGTMVADPYRWLEETNSEETGAWVAAQNAVTDRYLGALPERDALRERLTGLWNYERYGVPFREGGRYFFFKNDGLQNQSVLYLQESLEAEPRVLLDPNTLSADGTIALSTLDISRDGRYLGYGVSSGGSDWQEFRVREIESGRDLEDRIEWVKFSGLTWTHDGRGFFYSRYPAPAEGQAMLAANRDQKLYYHRVGTPQAEDLLVYERPDQPEWGIGASLTEDGRYALLYLSHGTDPRNRLYYIDLRDPQNPDFSAPVVPLLDDFDASYSVVGNEGPVLYLLTDREAPRKRIVAVDLRNPAPARWRTVVAEGEEVIEGAQIVGGRIVVSSLKDASSRILFYARDGKRLGELELPGIGTVGGVSGRPEGSELFYA
jgi:prolyl oligopeptidase